MRDLPEPLQQVDRTCVMWRGRTLAYFGGCDYFRLSSHPAVVRALREAATEFGLNVAASRKTTGNHELHERLERELARFFGAEKAVLLPNGYVTNFAVAQALEGEFTHVLVDERAHASLQDATVVFVAKRIAFRHRDASDLARVLQRIGRRARVMLLTDGLFAHDGSIAPLAQYLEALPRSARVLVDDAHGAGVLGRRGRGTPEHEGVGRERVIQTVTLSKAFGGYGGAVLAPREVIARIVERSRLFTGSTPLPLPLAAAALASLEILRSDTSLRRRLEHAAFGVKKLLRTALPDLPDNPSPILAVTPANERHASRLKRVLLRAAIFPSFIQYPGGPESGYFRFALSSEHTAGQLAALARVLHYHGRHVEAH